MQLRNYQFKPKLLPTLAVLIAVPIMVELGNWQSERARQKQALQDMYEARHSQPAIVLDTGRRDLEELRYRKVVVKGKYEPTWQILLDNRIYKDQAGYHVVTPLMIENSNIRVLVNRGWLPVGDDRNRLPEIQVPQGVVELSGMITLPPSKIYTLEKPEMHQGEWQVLWQNMDMEKYASLVPFSLYPIIIQLDKTSHGGYEREWQAPDLRAATNKGYALQWYGMAAVLAVFYLIITIRKKQDRREASND